MERDITRKELCDIYMDVMALKEMAKFIYENAEETVDKDFFRIYEKTLSTVSKKIEKYLN